MKNWFLTACVLFANSLLIADNGDCYIEPPECEMDNCHIPLENGCVEYEGYMLAFYDELCGSGRYLRADYLYWYGRDDQLAFALKAKAVPSTPEEQNSLVLVPEKYQYLGTKWNNGVRLTMGRHSSCDGWDSNLSWTYYRNKSQSSISVPTFSNPSFGENASFLPAPFQRVLINPWINQSFTPSDQVPTFYFNAIQAKSRFIFNQIDLELGRKYWLSQYFVLRPYAGGRGVGIKTELKTISSTFSGPFRDRFTNKTLAAGLVAGLQPNFYMTSNFALFGNISTSLVWGEFTVKKKENYFFQQTTPPPEILIEYNHKAKSRFFGMQAAIDLQLGLRWEVCWCCDQYRTAFDIGWEHHIWFDQTTRYKIPANTPLDMQEGINIQGFATFDQVIENLVMGGFIARVQFDF